MEFSCKPDFDMAMKRHEAFWHREIIDRPPVMISLPKPGAAPFPHKEYACDRDRWLDVEYRADELEHHIASTDFLYDALPTVWPNFGPEVFSAWCGCPYEFGETTTWSEPCVFDLERDSGKVRLDIEHPLFKLLVRFTELLIERGRGRFIVGLTDFHPGGDHLAALRDPMQLNIDLIDNPGWVDEMLTRSAPEYFAAYGVFYHMIREAGMPVTSWTPLAHDGTYYIPSNDFSCMISKEMFDRHFLPGIRQECMFYERSIYHLDGPDALRHLDSLLEIPELNAVQWVCGAGNEGFARWRKVYQKIQAGKKGIQLWFDLSEIDDVFASLRPEGVFVTGVGGVRDSDMAKAVVERIAKWK